MATLDLAGNELFKAGFSPVDRDSGLATLAVQFQLQTATAITFQSRGPGFRFGNLGAGERFSLTYRKFQSRKPGFRFSDFGFPVPH